MRHQRTGGFGRTAGGQAQGMFRTQAQFPRGGKIRSAGAAGKVQDQRPPGQGSAAGAAPSTGAGMVLMTASKCGRSCSNAVSGAACSPAQRAAARCSGARAAMVTCPPNACSRRPPPAQCAHTPTLGTHFPISCAGAAASAGPGTPSAVGTAFRQASSGRKK